MKKKINYNWHKSHTNKAELGLTQIALVCSGSSCIYLLLKIFWVPNVIGTLWQISFRFFLFLFLFFRKINYFFSLFIIFNLSRRLTSSVSSCTPACPYTILQSATVVYFEFCVKKKRIIYIPVLYTTA